MTIIQGCYPFGSKVSNNERMANTDATFQTVSPMWMQFDHFLSRFAIVPFRLICNPLSLPNPLCGGLPDTFVFM